MSQNVLEEADTLINGERNKQYGDATDEFTKVAQVWSAYLDREVTAFDFVNMMNLLKTMRARNGYHRDSYVDICGYSALAEKVHNKLAEAEPVEEESPLLTIPNGALIFDTILPQPNYLYGQPIPSPYNYAVAEDGVVSVVKAPVFADDFERSSLGGNWTFHTPEVTWTPDASVSVVVGGENPAMDGLLGARVFKATRLGHLEQPYNWQSDESSLIYTWADDWWYKAPDDEAEDPWYRWGFDVPADEGPFTLYTKPL